MKITFTPKEIETEVDYLEEHSCEVLLEVAKSLARQSLCGVKDNDGEECHTRMQKIYQALSNNIRSTMTKTIAVMQFEN